VTRLVLGLTCRSANSGGPGLLDASGQATEIKWVLGFVSSVCCFLEIEGFKKEYHSMGKYAKVLLAVGLVMVLAAPSMASIDARLRLLMDTADTCVQAPAGTGNDITIRLYVDGLRQGINGVHVRLTFDDASFVYNGAEVGDGGGMGSTDPWNNATEVEDTIYPDAADPGDFATPKHILWAGVLIGVGQCDAREGTVCRLSFTTKPTAAANTSIKFRADSAIIVEHRTVVTDCNSLPIKRSSPARLTVTDSPSIFLDNAAPVLGALTITDNYNGIPGGGANDNISKAGDIVHTAFTASDPGGATTPTITYQILAVDGLTVLASGTATSGGGTNYFVNYTVLVADMNGVATITITWHGLRQQRCDARRHVPD